MAESLEHLKVSVVVPTYNLKEVLLECLESIFNQDHTNLEVIVFDNGSTDGTDKAIMEKFPQVKFMQSQENLGVTGGANIGVKKATGDYIWLVDHDNILEPNMLSVMLELAESDPKIGIVVPKIYYWENKDIIWAAGAAINLLTGENIFRGGKDVGQYEKVEEVQVAPANFLVKREMIEKVGLYDDIYFATYEDTDFSFRAKKAGYKIVYTPKAVSYHKIPLLNKKQGKERWFKRAFWVARNKIIFMRKHSKYFPLFVLLYPAWFAIYTYQAVRYLNFVALLNFYKGMLVGFKWALFDYDKKSKFNIDFKKIFRTRGKETEEHELLLEQFFSLGFRRLTDIGVNILKHSRISPNQITIVRAIIFLPLIFYLFSRGTYVGNILGVLCCGLNSLFDVLDGNLARAKSLTSELGVWLDNSLDKLAAYVMFVGIILGSYTATQNNLLLIAGVFVLFLHGMLVFISEGLGRGFGEFVFFNFDLKEAIEHNKESTALDRIYLNMFGFHSYCSYIFFAIRYQVIIGAVFNIMPYIVFYWVFAFTLRLVFLYSVYSRILTKKKSRSLFINELKKRYQKRSEI